MEVARLKKRISVLQRKYVLDLLTKTVMLSYKPSDTPVKQEKNPEDVKNPMEINRYQRLVEKLIYLSQTRPDTASVVRQIS